MHLFVPMVFLWFFVLFRFTLHMMCGLHMMCVGLDEFADSYGHPMFFCYFWFTLHMMCGLHMMCVGLDEFAGSYGFPMVFLWFFIIFGSLYT